MENDMNPKKTNISVIILTKNEETRIETCIKSVSWADEIIVVDNGSTDKTREVVRGLGIKVIERHVSDFSSLRNAGRDVASGEWVLYVDADEVVSEQLQKEIMSVTGKQPFAGYEIRRVNYFLGHQWPGDEYILRLMRNDALVEWYGILHESARVKGTIGRLKNSLVHRTHRTLEEMVTKTNVWSGTEAKLRYDSNHPPIVWWRLVRVMVSAFFDSFIHKGGWRAGTVGWIESVYQAFSMFITYAKLWELQMKNIK